MHAQPNVINISRENPIKVTLVNVNDDGTTSPVGTIFTLQPRENQHISIQRGQRLIIDWLPTDEEAEQIAAEEAGD